jgi:hypothetical protein
LKRRNKKRRNERKHRNDKIAFVTKHRNEKQRNKMKMVVWNTGFETQENKENRYLASPHYKKIPYK